jgi:hypothetical protein
MRRRDVLRGGGVVLAGVSLAGCAGSEPDATDADAGGESRETVTTPTPVDPVSRLTVEGFLTGEEDTATVQAEISARNPTDRAATAEFSAAAVLDEARGTITSEPTEQVVPAGASETFRVDLADVTALRFEELTGLVFEGFQLRILVNDEPQPEACPSSPLGDPNADGCGYPFGITPTHVQVEYGGNWQGAVGTSRGTRSVSRGSIPYGAPRGYSTSYIGVNSETNTVSVNAQKRDDSAEPLTVRILHEGETVAEQRTSSAYGVAQASTDL